MSRSQQTAAASNRLVSRLRAALDQKTKPPGSLGRLEDLAVSIGTALGTTAPRLRRPTVMVFAADHGVARHGVSAYPQEVTWQMVENFRRGGAAISVLCRQFGIRLEVVDAGVDHDFAVGRGVIGAKVGRGTMPFHLGPAMTVGQCRKAMALGARLLRQQAARGCNAIGFGEMGIGSTSSAAMIMHFTTGISLNRCVGRGTGVAGPAMARKRKVLRLAAARHAAARGPLAILRAVGGFEIAMMTGAMVAAASRRMVFVVDGFIATAAYSLALQIEPRVALRALFAHEGDERGHRDFLKALGAVPLLRLGLRLGEATGAVLAFPLLQAATAVLNDMASFTSAGVARAR